MSVRFVDKTIQVRGNIQQKASIFMRLITDKIVDIAEPNTPYKGGNLSRDTVKSVVGLHGRIAWNKDYASYQEAGQRRDGSHKVTKYTKAGTGPHYAEDAVKEGIKNTGIIAKRAGMS